MKRIRFKKPFSGYDNVVGLIPENYKVNGNEFEMTDSNETYRMKWDNGKAKVVNAYDKTVMKEGFDKIKHLMNYKPEATLGRLDNDKRLAENTIFTTRLTESLERMKAEKDKE